MRKHSNSISHLDRTVKCIILEIVVRRLVYVGNLTVMHMLVTLSFPSMNLSVMLRLGWHGHFID
jgi:hypothetical protein